MELYKKELDFTENNKNFYQTAVSVNGFLFTGASAVLDLLRECDTTTVISATINPQTQNRKDLGYGEVSFFRGCGFAELRDAFLFGDDSRFNSECLKFIYNYYETYKTSMNYDAVVSFQSSLLFKKYMDEFLISILDLNENDIEFLKNNQDYFFQYNVERILGGNRYFSESEVSDKIINSFLSFNKGHYIFYKRKNLTKQEFDTNLKTLITKILQSIHSEKYLVLDNLLARIPLNTISTCMPDNLKQITLMRDVRDSFFTVQHYKLDYLNNFDHCDVVKYSKYMRDLDVLNKYADKKNMLLIWLEDLILNYEDTKNKIFNFLELDPALHVNQFAYFDPKVSAKHSIGVYKNYHDQKIIEKLEELCPELCYHP